MIAVAILFIVVLVALFWATATSPFGCERPGIGFTDCRRCSRRYTCRHNNFQSRHIPNQSAGYTHGAGQSGDSYGRGKSA